MKTTQRREPKTTKSTAEIAGHRLDRGTLALLVTLALGVFAGALDLGVLSPALPAIAAHFAVDARDAAFVVTIYLLANVASIPVATKLADRYGRRSVYIGCVAVFAVGSLLAIIAPSFAFLLCGRAVQAAGAGGIFPVAAAAIADRVPLERRGAALGILGAIWGVAGILGPIIGGLLTNFLNWRWIFIADIPLSAFVIILAQRHLPAKAPARRGPLDVAGVLLLSATLVGTMIALTRLDPRLAGLGPLSGPTVTASAAVVALLSLLALVGVERRAQEPVIPPRLLAKRQILVTYGVEILIGALEGALFFVPAALVAGQGLGEAAAGGIASIGAVLFVAVIPLAGRALDRIGSRSVLTLGALVTAAGLALFALGYASLPLSVLAMVVAGAGFGALLGAPTRYIISNEAPPESRAAAIGLLSVFLIIGQILGGSLVGGLIGSATIAAGSYRTAFLTFAALALLASATTTLLAPRSAAIPSATSPKAF